MNGVSLKRIWQTRRLSFVPRWVVIPTIRKQNVAEHSFHVVVIADQLLKMHQMGGVHNFDVSVLQSALYHDEDESITGDHPSPSKDGTRRSPSTLTQAEIIVKVADKIEAVLFCSEELTMGNTSIKEIKEDAIVRGKRYWELFAYNDVVGTRPEFEDLCGVIAEGTTILKHPVIHKW